MKVVFPANRVLFEDLEIGEVFRLNENVYMKTCTLTCSDTLRVSAVDLETGRFKSMNELSEVEKLNGEYIIK